MAANKFQNEDFDTRLAKVETEISGMKEMIVGVVSNIHSIQTSLSSGKQTNWALILALVTAVALVIGGVYTTLSSETEKWALKSQMEMMAYAQPIIMAAEQSKVDRAELHSAASGNSTRISNLEASQAASQASVKERLRETETQLKNAGIIVNMNASNQASINGILWKKVFGEDLPHYPIYPSFHRED